MAQDVFFFHNPLNQTILRFPEMSENIVHCRSCQAPMERHKISETRYENGELHQINEYRCKRCRSILIKDLGVVTPFSGTFIEVSVDKQTLASPD